MTAETKIVRTRHDSGEAVDDSYDVLDRETGERLGRVMRWGDWGTWQARVGSRMVDRIVTRREAVSQVVAIARRQS